MIYIQDLKNKFNNSKIRAYFSNKKTKNYLKLILYAIPLFVGAYFLYSENKIMKNLSEYHKESYAYRKDLAEKSTIDFLSEEERNLFLNYIEINKKDNKNYEDLNQNLDIKELLKNSRYYKDLDLIEFSTKDFLLTDIHAIATYKTYESENEYYVLDNENNLIYQEKDLKLEELEKLNKIIDKILIKNKDYLSTGNFNDIENWIKNRNSTEKFILELNIKVEQEIINIEIFKIYENNYSLNFRKYKTIYDPNMLIPETYEYIYKNRFNYNVFLSDIHGGSGDRVEVLDFIRTDNIKYSLSKFYDYEKEVKNYYIEKKGNNYYYIYENNKNTLLIEKNINMNELFLSIHKNVVFNNIIALSLFLLGLFKSINTLIKIRNSDNKMKKDIKPELLNKKDNSILNETYDTIKENKKI